MSRTRIVVSTSPKQDALDHAVRDWDFSRTAEYSGDPLIHLLTLEDNLDEVDQIISMHESFKCVTRPEHDPDAN